MRPINMLKISSCLGIILVLYVWVKVDVVRMGYAIEHLTQKRMALIREQEQLQIQLSRLTAPDLLAARAQQVLGMVAPDAGQIVLVSISPEPSSPEGQEPIPIQLAQRAVRVQ